MNTNLKNDEFKDINIKKNNNKASFINSKMSSSNLKNDVSFSMFVDNTKRINYNKPLCNKNKYKKKKKKSYYGNIEKRNLKLWVNDTNVSKCYSCNNPFSFYLRKHHCRCCGRIFCYYCCCNWIDIPYEITENELPIQNTSNNLGILSTDCTSDFKHLRKNQRVCSQCIKKIDEIKNLKPIIQVFDLLDLNVKDYRIMKQVCKTWRSISNYYLSNFRELQYSLPNHKFTKREKEILLQNSCLFHGHSKLIVQLIKSIDWKYADENIEKCVLDLLYSNKRICKCWTLMCTRDCRKTLKAEDCIQLLYPEITNYTIRNYAVECLKKTSIEELLCYLPFLIYHIRYELFHENNYTKLISNLLITKSKSNHLFALEAYWELYSQKNNPDYKLVSCYEKIMKIIQINLDINFSKSIKMISLLETFKTLPIDKIKSSLKNEKINFENIPFPFTKGSKINIEKTIRMKSATKPLMFTYYNRNNVERKILFKYEDIRKERIIMKIIKLMDIILKRDNIDLNFVTYGILPIGIEAGFINVVPNSKTLYNIELKEKFSIQNYIIENNPNLPINMIRENFIKSCAASCVISYLLGLGDRHLDNIMVTETGLLFHIDFGYILGNDPKPLAPVMKITPETIDAMGGENSKGYKLFQSLCSKSYNCLRRHSNIFLTLLTMLSKLTPEIDDGKFNEEFIKNQIIKRFIPGELYKEAELQYNTQINNCYNTSSLIDICHYHKKETIDRNLDRISGLFANIRDTFSSYIYQSSPSID